MSLIFFVPYYLGLPSPCPLIFQNFCLASLTDCPLLIILGVSIEREILIPAIRSLVGRGREDVSNLTLGNPSSTNRNLLGEIHKVNPEILGYPRIPGSPLTTSLLREIAHKKEKT